MRNPLQTVKIWVVLMALILLPILLLQSYAQYSVASLTVTVNKDNTVTVSNSLNTDITAARIEVQAITAKIKNIIATDEKGKVLSTSLSGNTIRIDTLGARHVSLEYNADILTKTGNVYTLKYTTKSQSTVALQSDFDLVYVNTIPIQLKDNTLVMPAGDVELSYIPKAAAIRNFTVKWDNQDFVVQLLTSASVKNPAFDQNSKKLSFDINGKGSITAIIPKKLLGAPYTVSLNGKTIEQKLFHQNSTDAWVRIDAANSGTIEVKGATVIPEFPIVIPQFIVALSILTLLMLKKYRVGSW